MLDVPGFFRDQGTVRVTLADTGMKILNKPGGKMFELYVTTNPNQPAIDAYFCPYQNDKAFFITLGNAASYMFTPQMAGCSFGIGTQNQGTCRVGHVNFISLRQDWDDENDKRARMYQAQRQFLSHKLNIGQGRIVDPTVYSGPDLDYSATTFGVRNNQQVWSFHTLRYKRPGSRTYWHYGIHQHVNN